MKGYCSKGNRNTGTGLGSLRCSSCWGLRSRNLGWIYLQVQGWWWRVQCNTCPDTKKEISKNHQNKPAITTLGKRRWWIMYGELCMDLQSEYVIQMEFNATTEKKWFHTMMSGYKNRSLWGIMERQGILWKAWELSSTHSVSDDLK